MKSLKILQLFYPHNLVVITVLTSAAVWSLPFVNGLRRGFQDRAEITAQGLAVLMGWYGAIYLLSRFGFRIGCRLKTPVVLKKTISYHRPLAYRILVVIGVAGMAATYYQIASVLGVAGMINSIQRSTANDLKEALYADYSIGLMSLRYVSAISGGIGAARLTLNRRSYSVFDIVAVASWLATALLASRLSIIWGILTALTFWLTSIESISRKFILRIVFVGAFAFAALWTLNYTRNANYYRAKGTDDFALSGLGEMVTYVGSPFQVSLGVANNLGSALKGVEAKDLVEWDQSLSTDSAFERTITLMGSWAFPYMFLTVFVYSLIAGFCFSARGTWIFAGFPVAVYAFAEIWRVDLFSQGIFYTNLFCGIAIPFAVSLISIPRSAGTRYSPIPAGRPPRMFGKAERPFSTRTKYKSIF